MINSEIGEVLGSEFDVEVVVVPYGPSGNLRENLPLIAIQSGLIKNEDEFYALSKEISTQMAKGQVQEALGSREALVSQTVQLLNEIDTDLNGLSSKLREWYSLHYPELGRIIRDRNQLYAKFVIEVGDRTKITKEKLESIGVQRRELTAILKDADKSMGALLNESDLTQIMILAQQILALHKYRLDLTSYISSLAEEIAPNTSFLAGSILGAKLIEKGGDH